MRETGLLFSSSRADSYGDDWASDNESVSSNMIDEDLDEELAPVEEALDPLLGHNMPKPEMRVLYEQMEGPWRKQYRRIMRKKPRKIYLQITTGRGHDFSASDKNYLSQCKTTVPIHQFRVYSLGGIHRTTGFTSPVVYLPNSYRQKIKVFRELEIMKTHDAALMLAAHICWLNRRENEFLSWTSSLLFLFSHGILRHEKGQKDICVAFGNTRKLETPERKQGSFYQTTDLLDLLGYADVSQLTAFTVRKLHPRHFTHESLGFGEMRDPHGAVIHVEFEELIRNGLLELLPELIIDSSGYDDFCERTGLYQFFVWLKNKLFRDAVAKRISASELQIARRLASLFTAEDEDKVPFWAFIKFVSMRLRTPVNLEFREFVTLHFDATDVTEGVYRDMEKVADNLPDVLQTMKLAREAAEALHLHPNPVPEIEIVRSGRMHAYRGEDDHFPARQFYTQLDRLSDYLIEQDIYGDDETAVAARRAWADCEGDMAELLKLSRLSSKKDDDAIDLAAVPSLENIQWMEDSEVTFIADSVGRIVKNPKYLPKKPAGKKKATNKQNREELRRKTGQLSPKEVRLEKERKRAAELEAEQRADQEAEQRADQEAEEQAERSLDAAAETLASPPSSESNACNYQVISKATSSKKRSSVYQHSSWSPLEDVTPKKRRREKTQEEIKSDFLARLELLSGRLFRRKTSRNNIAAGHQYWFEEVRLNFLYDIAHKTFDNGLDRIGMNGVDFKDKSARKAGIGEAVMVV